METLTKWNIQLYTAILYGEKIDRLLRERKFKMSMVYGKVAVCLPWRAYQACVAYTSGRILLSPTKATGQSYTAKMSGEHRRYLWLEAVYAVRDYRGYQKIYTTHPWRKE